MGLTDEQAAALDTVVQAIWDTHVDDVQAARADLLAARRGYAAACVAYGQVAAPLHRKALTGHLSAAEADEIDTARAVVDDAHAAVAAAVEGLEDARRRFKAGVTPEQIEEVMSR